MQTCNKEHQCDINSIEQVLVAHHIRPTSSRIMILKEMMHYDVTFSLVDLETSLGTVDKSTIFRAITLFLTHHLLHVIDDGSGSTKYCICTHKECSIEKMHAHFHCLICNKTYCIESAQIPLINLESGFEPQSINYTISGICPSCHKKKK